jgi:hypothetical protein
MGRRDFSSALRFCNRTQQAIKRCLELGRKKTVEVMAPHVSHTGVHDHGFNNVSTYGNLLRLMHEGKTVFNEWEKNFYEVALKISGAVQASRWTVIKDGGFIHSFNGAHSLFVDTIRSVRSLILGHILGHVLQAEGDQKISLLDRAIQHIKATAKYAVFYGEGRDMYDVWGRTAHESIFNVKDGNFRCPNSQQGYSGFTTWTRGLAWAMCGFSEELEWLDTINEKELEAFTMNDDFMSLVLTAAKATCDFYIDNTPVDGVPYWDTGAPGLNKLGDYLNRPAEPFNDYEPVDSSAAAIAAQGLLRLGNYLHQRGDEVTAKALFAGRTNDTAHNVRRALFKYCCGSPGTVVAFYLSSSQWMGLCSCIKQNSLWRIKHVGRLPCT